VVTSQKTCKEERLAREERSDDENASRGSASGENGMEVNMVFELPSQFQAPRREVVELVLGARVATFEKPGRLGHHMKPFFVKGYLEGRLVQRITVDGGAGVNLMPLITFDKLGYREGELMKINMSLSAFTGEITEAKGVSSVELTVGSKTLAATFSWWM
jgi:hypothetical protein